jgi:biotin synthase
MTGFTSMFSSDARMMLTGVSPTNDYDEDAQLLNKLGLHPRVPFKDAPNAKTAGCASAATATLQEK